MKKGKLLGLDIGEKRVGYAVTDEDQTICFPRGMIQAKPHAGFFKKLEELVVAEKICGIVIGLPLNEENEPTTYSEKIKKMAEEIEQKTHLHVFFVDEFGSSNEALSKIPFRKDRKREQGSRDAIAAQIILERYLEKRSYPIQE